MLRQAQLHSDIQGKVNFNLLLVIIIIVVIVIIILVVSKHRVNYKQALCNEQYTQPKEFQFHSIKRLDHGTVEARIPMHSKT